MYSGNASLLNVLKMIHPNETFMASQHVLIDHNIHRIQQLKHRVESGDYPDTLPESLVENKPNCSAQVYAQFTPISQDYNMSLVHQWEQGCSFTFYYFILCFICV